MIAEAIGIARDFGLVVDEVVPLRSTNNAVAWLKPTRVVAKVGAGRNSKLRIELEVAIELSVRAGPVVSPARELPAVVHSRNGLDVTFWQYHAQESSAQITPARLGQGLQRLHAALLTFSPQLRGRLPSFLSELDFARSFLANSVVTSLAESDRWLLADTCDRLRKALDDFASPDAYTAIHGGPHSYNVLQVDEEPCFIDFETACIGPVEWDAAFLSDAALQYYERALNQRLLWVCRGLASIATAAFCWSDVHRGDLREHAAMHLAHVRANVAPYV